jgi:hypothetical protein
MVSNPFFCLNRQSKFNRIIRNEPTNSIIEDVKSILYCVSLGYLMAFCCCDNWVLHLQTAKQCWTSVRDFGSLNCFEVAVQLFVGCYQPTRTICSYLIRSSQCLTTYHTCCCCAMIHSNSQNSSWNIRRTKNWTPWPQSASELYRPSERRLSAKLVPTFVDRGCCVVSATNSHGR